MNKPTILRSTTPVVAVVLTLTNVLSFTLGLSIAGRSVIQRFLSPRPVAPIAEAGSLTGVLFGRAAAPAHPLPIQGKGMWIYQFDKVARGDPNRIVRLAVQRGLTHIYVRAGSSVSGLSGWHNIVKILPVAHRAGLRVIAWDFPYLHSPGRDVRRAAFVLGHTVKGEHVDGFAADVETRSEGTVLTRSRARRYAANLRLIAPKSFLVLVPPRPTSWVRSFYPYDLLVPHFDAVAPMVYWGRTPAAQAAEQAMAFLRRFGKPIAPIGQAYDMGPDGGPKGPPKGKALVHFMNEAVAKGAIGVSFWSWQHTPARLWHTIDTYRWPAAKQRA